MFDMIEKLFDKRGDDNDDDALTYKERSEFNTDKNIDVDKLVDEIDADTKLWEMDENDAPEIAMCRECGRDTENAITRVCDECLDDYIERELVIIIEKKAREKNEKADRIVA